jgi:hypothetical protein
VRINCLWLIFGSNFRNDTELLSLDKGSAFYLNGSESFRLCPSQNLAWGAERSKEGLTTLEFVALVGLEAHQSYWGNQMEGERTAFAMTISETAVLSFCPKHLGDVNVLRVSHRCAERRASQAGWSFLLG